MRKILILIIIGFVVFVVGGGCGVLYQQQKETPELQSEQGNPVLAKITSKTIPLITAAGQVAKIDGRNITLVSGGDSLMVKIRDDAQIFSIMLPADGKEAVKKNIEFKDIKKGDNLDIDIKFLSDGQIEGYLAVVMLQPGK